MNIGLITFVNNERFGGYDGPLQLFAAEGGTVDMRVAFIDGGTGVNSSITKAGRGEVRLLGSSLGDSTVEAVHVLGGFLTFTFVDKGISFWLAMPLAALSVGLMAGVLESHLREEFGHLAEPDAAQQKSIDDVVSLVRSYLR